MSLEQDQMEKWFDRRCGIQEISESRSKIVLMHVIAIVLLLISVVAILWMYDDTFLTYLLIAIPTALIVILGYKVITDIMK